MKLELLIACCFTMASSLRFGNNPVTVDTEVIILGRPATLTCNYVKYHTESVREINWYAGYTGFRSKIFLYSISTGRKEGSAFPFIKTDSDSATQNELTVTITEMRDPFLTIACEVESMRDDGYGKLRHNKKLGESTVKVIGTEDHIMELKPDPTHGITVSVGKPISVTCISRGVDPPPKLSIKFAGKNVTEIYGGRLEEIGSGISNNSGVIGSVQEVTEIMLRNGVMTVECLAHFDNYLFGKREILMEKLTAENRWPGESDRRHSSDIDEINEVGVGTGRQGRNHEIHSRLLELTDPSRHVHPGIPYDFFSGYLIMLSDNINPNSEVTSDYVKLLGELPEDVETALKRHFGRVNQVSSLQTVVKLDAVKVMNMLGSLGYRAVAASGYGADGFLWTMERKDFNKGAAKDAYN